MDCTRHRVLSDAYLTALKPDPTGGARQHQGPQRAADAGAGRRQAVHLGAGAPGGQRQADWAVHGRRRHRRPGHLPVAGVQPRLYCSVCAVACLYSVLLGCSTFALLGQDTWPRGCRYANHTQNMITHTCLTVDLCSFLRSRLMLTWMSLRRAQMVVGCARNSSGRLQPPTPEDCPGDVWALIQQCTSGKAAERPTAKVQSSCKNRLSVAA